MYMLYKPRHYYTTGAVGCAMNAVTLALIDAGIPLRDFVVSATTAYISSVPLLGN